MRIVEIYNGGSRGDEDKVADQRWRKIYGYLGIGGSDAHIVSHIGRCATRFSGPIKSEAEIVEALNAGEFEADHQPGLRPICIRRAVRAPVQARPLQRPRLIPIRLV